MNKIKSFTLKYFCLGTPKDNNFRVYLRYYVTINGKGSSLSIPTDYKLTKHQVKMLNKNELNGAIQRDLNKFKDNIEQVVFGIQAMYNTYPTPDQLKEYFKSIENTLPMDYYVNNYFKKLGTKFSSKRIYSGRIHYFVEYYRLNLKNLPIRNLINKKTIENFGIFLKEQRIGKKKKPLSKVQIFNIRTTAIRFLNYIADEVNMPKIPFYLKRPQYGDTFTPTLEQFNRLITEVSLLIKC